MIYASGAIANGTAVSPTNLNKDSSNDAQCTFTHDAGATAITVGTDGLILDEIALTAYGHEEFRLNDSLRLGQNDAIALKVVAGTSTPDIWGVIFLYFE